MLITLDLRCGHRRRSVIRRIWLGQSRVGGQFHVRTYADFVLIPVELCRVDVPVAFFESGCSCLFACGRSIDIEALKRN